MPARSQVSRSVVPNMWDMIRCAEGLAPGRDSTPKLRRHHLVTYDSSLPVGALLASA